MKNFGHLYFFFLEILLFSRQINSRNVSETFSEICNKR